MCVWKLNKWAFFLFHQESSKMVVHNLFNFPLKIYKLMGLKLEYNSTRQDKFIKFLAGICTASVFAYSFIMLHFIFDSNNTSGERIEIIPFFLLSIESVVKLTTFLKFRPDIKEFINCFVSIIDSGEYQRIFFWIFVR